MMKLNIQMFASTNKTANYELPQFIGSDKPTWLGDFNTAMATIDGGMAENKSEIESMDSRVTSAEATASQASQNVSTLTTRVSSVESSVSTATTTANNAQQTATSALNTANTANGKADTNTTAITNLTGDVASLESYLTLSDTRKLTNPTITRGGGTIEGEDIRVALNSNGTAGKIYGRIAIRGQNGYGIVKYINTGIMGVTEKFGISPVGVSYANPVSGGNEVDSAKIFINPPEAGETSASIEVIMGNWSSGVSVTCLMPCMYFFKDFEDTQQ